MLRALTYSAGEMADIFSLIQLAIAHYMLKQLGVTVLISVELTFTLSYLK